MSYIGLTVASFALPLIVLSTLAGQISDRIGRVRMIALPILPIAAIYISYAYNTNLVAILIVSLVEGVIATFQGPALSGFLADASPPQMRGRVQGLAASLGSLGGVIGAFLSLPLYETSRVLVFAMMAAVFIGGTGTAALGAWRWSQHPQTSAFLPHDTPDQAAIHVERAEQMPHPS